MADRQTLKTDFLPLEGSPPVEWVIDDEPIPYEVAQKEMEERVAAIATGEAAERVWLLEHPPLYTAGTSADPADLIAKDRFPVYETGRGGQYTYHGPGQRVAYVMLDLKRRQQDVRAFVAALEQWLIDTLWQHHVRGERREDRVGVWVQRPEKGEGVEDKIAAIGIRLRKWVTFHGISLNVDPDLEHFTGIVPCGVQKHGVTSFVDLGLPLTMPEVDIILRQQFEEIFGATVSVDSSTLAQTGHSE
ncbi:octanoyltransferase [Pseudovibrio japonicus]|uniref:Octanoyltransferase n=1 Tax=Pseudovibrio japonicus TaxID=366534 RepID=A0ABQ3EV93_9HYPH|nr:lipoyl(octanoyl) transferase LipB [Pseudovibrio japonicus]GHB48662.1 octanoyltransferase [Pseudovibrio japonicus]